MRQTCRPAMAQKQLADTLVAQRAACCAEREHASPDHLTLPRWAAGDPLLHIVHTKEGAKAACATLAYGTGAGSTREARQGAGWEMTGAAHHRGSVPA